MAGWVGQSKENKAKESFSAASAGYYQSSDNLNSGRYFANSLSGAEHVHNARNSYSQALHALRVLRAHVMDDASLQTMYRSIIIAKLTYASSAWWGFTSATDRQQLEAFTRRSDYSGFVPANLPAFADSAWQLTRSYLRPLSGTITKIHKLLPRHSIDNYFIQHMPFDGGRHDVRY